MIKERFGCRNVRVVLRAHSRRTYVEVRLNQLLLSLRGNRETRLVLVGGWCLEVVLMQCLVVGQWVLRRVLGTAVVADLEVVRLQVLHEVSRRLHVLRCRRVDKLLRLR